VVSAIRLVVQLALMALVLKLLFATASPWLTGLTAVVMIAFAAREVVARQSRPLRGIWGYGIGAGAVFFAGIVITTLALTVQLRPDPWYDPRYAIPLLGMVLGNAMTGISLALERLLSGAVRERAAIEAQLALGATRYQALAFVNRDALRAGFTPIINSMAASGVVFLPGMVTGQILAGVAPQDAVKYQILIMFLIAGAVGIGALTAVYGGVRRLTDARHRLRLDRLVAPP
jgi:putative ABC transport system permease protein